MMVSLVLPVSASAAGQGAERITGDHSVAPGSWKQLAKLTEAKGRSEDNAGWSVAISKDGGTVAVGAAGCAGTRGTTGAGKAQFAPQKSGKYKYSVVHNFTSADGGVQPFYALILDGKGHLFGVTSNFGQYGGGTAFEVTP